MINHHSRKFIWKLTSCTDTPLTKRNPQNILIFHWWYTKNNPETYFREH